MRLSMWILERWLMDYSPVTTIRKGLAELEGARLFSQSHRFTPCKNYVYVGKTKDFFPESESDEVLLLHGNDVIGLHSIDLEDVFNQVVSAFEFYNAWENQLFTAARQEHAEQKIVDACDGMFGPTFLLDLKFNLIAYSRNYELGQVNFIWDEYIQMKSSSLKTIYRMKTSNFSKLISVKHDCLIFEEPTAYPFYHGIMVSYCDDNGALIGQLTVAFDHDPTICEQQLVRVVEKALDSVGNKHKRGVNNYRAQAVLAESLIKERFDPEEKEKLLLLQGWEEADRFCFIVAQSPEAIDKATQESLTSRIGDIFNDSIVFDFEERVICLTTTKKQDITQKVNDLCNLVPLSYGISRIFTNLEDASFYYRQALDAIAYGSTRKQPATYFSDCGLYVLSHLFQGDYYRYCLHPAISLLIDYDKKHRTEFARTLQLYLQNERSPQTTAKELYVHKNTILYRIDRITKLCGIHLDDSNEREYLLASFRAME